MAVICADCRTANREGAKFCKGCGHRLRTAPAANAAEPASEIDAEWPATLRMPLRDEVTPADLPASRLSSGGRSQTAESARSTKPSAVRKTRPNRMTVWGLLAAVIVVAGGWYAYSSRITAVPTVVPGPPPPPVAQPMPAPVVIPAPEPAPVEPSPSPPAEPPVEPPQATPAKPVVAPARKSRKTQAPAPAAPQAPAVPVAPVPAPPPEPAAPASPQAACDGLNFFARARCMAAQCAMADYKAHPQCDAVRRQQQIEEEKRNPTLIN